MTGSGTDNSREKLHPPPAPTEKPTVECAALSLKQLSEQAVAAHRPSGESNLLIPHIVLEQKGGAVAEDGTEPSDYELGSKGLLSDTYHRILCQWFAAGKDMEVPSYKLHEVDLNCKHELGAVLREVATLVQSTVTDLDVRTFSKRCDDDGCDQFMPLSEESPAGDNTFLMICRNFSVWKNIVDGEKTDLLFLRKSFSKYLQCFPSLIPCAAAGGEPVYLHTGTGTTHFTGGSYSSQETDYCIWSMCIV